VVCKSLRDRQTTDYLGKRRSRKRFSERNTRKLIKVKLEIDTNPPMESGYETRFVTLLRNISSDDLKGHSEPFRLGQAQTLENFILQVGH